MRHVERLKRWVRPAVLLAVAVFVVADVAANVTIHATAARAVAVGIALSVLALLVFPFYGALGVFAFASTLAWLSPLEVEDSGAGFVSFIVASWWVGRFAEQRIAPAGLLAALAGVTFVNHQFEGTRSDYLWTFIFISAAWLAGFVIAQRTLRAHTLEHRAKLLEAESDRLARAAVADERRRIARELHDVIAHSVSVMTVQAGATRRLLHPDQERERTALETIEATGRDALTEMRRLVGLLKEQDGAPDYAPQPGLQALDGLLGSVRDAGLPVQLTVDGVPKPLAPGLDLAAYRVVQEALTNALKYAGPAHAWVTVRWGADDLQLEVANDGATAVAGDGGHGLTGMKERVALYGGRVETGPRDGGGFVVRASLPLQELPS